MQQIKSITYEKLVNVKYLCTVVTVPEITIYIEYAAIN